MKMGKKKMTFGFAIFLTILFFLNLWSTSSKYFSGLKSLNFSSLKSSSISVLVITTDNYLKVYEQHLISSACYARRHSHRFNLVRPQEYPVCLNQSRSFFYQKHCIIQRYLVDNVDIDWLLILDMDVIILNMSKTIESYIPSPSDQSSVDLIFYERFNGEVVSGNFLIRNRPWSHEFLLGWLDYEKGTSHFKFHNYDNGALHLYLLSPMIGNVSRLSYERCLRMYERASDPTSYHAYVGCCKCALGGRWTFEHLHILRRGHSFIRDNLGVELEKRIWFPTDFYLHGQKKDLEKYYSKKIDPYKCTTSQWTLPIREDAIMYNFTQVKETVRKYDEEAALAYPNSVGLPEIGECWPNCQETEARRKAFMDKVCTLNFLY